METKAVFIEGRVDRKYGEASEEASESCKLDLKVAIRTVTVHHEDGGGGIDTELAEPKEPIGVLRLQIVRPEGDAYEAFDAFSLGSKIKVAVQTESDFQIARFRDKKRENLLGSIAMLRALSELSTEQRERVFSEIRENGISEEIVEEIVEEIRLSRGPFLQKKTKKEVS